MMRTMLRRRLLLAFLISVAAPDLALAQQSSGIDLSAIDRSVRPQEDFWRFANGRWLAATSIPVDRPAWDTFNALREATQGQLRGLIEGIDPRGTDLERRKLADFYASFMDEKGVETAGLGG